MTSPIIQLPFLRPENVREVPGGIGGMGTALEGIGQMLAARQDQMQKMLLLKGHLALAQEKFDTETKQRNEDEKQREALGQQITAALTPQAMQTPGGMAGAIGQIAGPMTAAGMNPESMMGELPKLQQQQRVDNTTAALGQLWTEFNSNPKNATNPIAQHTFLMHAALIDPDRAQGFASILKDQSGKFTAIVGNDGDIYTLNQQDGTVTKTGFNGGPKGKNGIAPEKLQAGALMAAQQLRDMVELVKHNPQADIMPTTAAAIRNAKVSGGLVGGLAGLAEPFAQSQLLPEQQQFQRMVDNFIPTYMGVVGSGSRGGQYLINLIRNGIAPVAGQTDQGVRSDAARIRNNLLTLLTQMGSGKTVDMTQLLGFNAAAQDFGDYRNTPTAPQAPQPFTGTPNFQDFRNGPPQP